MSIRSSRRPVGLVPRSPHSADTQSPEKSVDVRIVEARETLEALLVEKYSITAPPESPLRLKICDFDGTPIRCDEEYSFNLEQIGVLMRLVCGMIGVDPSYAKLRRDKIVSLVEYFDSLREGLGLRSNLPILYQYLCRVRPPQMRQTPALVAVEERGFSRLLVSAQVKPRRYQRSSVAIPDYSASDFSGKGWLPKGFLKGLENWSELDLARNFPDIGLKLTVYKICYFIAMMGSRRSMGVINFLSHVRTHLGLTAEGRCLVISSEIASRTNHLSFVLRYPKQSSGPMAILATKIFAPGEAAAKVLDRESLRRIMLVARGSGVLQGDFESLCSCDTDELVQLMHPADHLAALTFILEVALVEGCFSDQSLMESVKIIDAMAPGEGKLTGLLLRVEFDTGRRISLPRQYRIDYSKQRLRYRGMSY